MAHSANVLIVTCHPEPRSFTFALTDVAATTLAARGAQVQRTDVHQAGLGGPPSRDDLRAFPADQPFRVRSAQLHADRYGGFGEPVVLEQEKLRWCDLLLLQFPLWWGTFPSGMKAWIERVLTYGFAYGPGRDLPPKTVALSVTTGGVGSASERRAGRVRLDRMARDVFGYIGWTLRPPLMAYGPGHASPAQRDTMLREHARRVVALLPGRAPELEAGFRHGAVGSTDGDEDGQ